VADIAASWLPIGYAGVLSCGVAYTLQIVGQKYAEPAVASIVMSLESVFAVLGGVLLLWQIPSLTELAGCALMFAATIISQLPERK
jgi:drug/metabolite transporter (DMT)-like permease